MPYPRSTCIATITIIATTKPAITNHPFCILPSVEKFSSSLESVAGSFGFFCVFILNPSRIKAFTNPRAQQSARELASLQEIRKSQRRIILAMRLIAWNAVERVDGADGANSGAVRVGGLNMGEGKSPFAKKRLQQMRQAHRSEAYGRRTGPWPEFRFW